MHVSMPTMSGIVDRLVNAHYLKRVNNPTDRRQVVVELAADGQRLIEQFQSAVSKRWVEVLSHLNHQEITMFQNIVSKIGMSLQKKEGL